MTHDVRVKRAAGTALVGKHVRFAHLADEPANYHRVKSVNSFGMITLEGFSGEFAPHLFVTVRDETRTREVGDIVEIPGEKLAPGYARVKVGSVYHYADSPSRCPLCRGVGMQWVGWFHCEDCGLVALVSTGESFILVRIRVTQASEVAA